MREFSCLEMYEDAVLEYALEDRNTMPTYTLFIMAPMEPFGPLWISSDAVSTYRPGTTMDSGTTIQTSMMAELWC